LRRYNQLNINVLKILVMVTQEKQIVETLLFADGRAEIIEKFTRWVNELPFGH